MTSSIDFVDGDGSAALGIEPETVRHLARLAVDGGLAELRVETGTVRVTLRTTAYQRTVAATASPVLAEAMATEPATVATEETEEPAGIAIEAPLMGVFYRAPAPGEPPFVEVDDLVDEGQPVGMIEAMKVFSEVLSEVAGRVTAIPAKNGALVQPGDVLLRIEAP